MLYLCINEERLKTEGDLRKKIVSTVKAQAETEDLKVSFRSIPDKLPTGLLLHSHTLLLSNRIIDKTNQHNRIFAVMTLTQKDKTTWL